MATTRLVRPARILCRSGWNCELPATLRATSPRLDQPLDRCTYHLGEAITAAQWALAEAGHPTVVTVAPISREG